LNSELRKRFPCVSDMLSQRIIKVQNDFVPVGSIRGVYHLGPKFPDLISSRLSISPEAPLNHNFTVWVEGRTEHFFRLEPKLLWLFAQS